MLKSVKLTTCNFANVDEWGDMHACNVRSKQAFYRCSGCLKGTTTVKRIPVREKRKELEKKKKVRNCRSSQLVVAVAAAAAAVCCRRGITGWWNEWPNVVSKHQRIKFDAHTHLAPHWWSLSGRTCLLRPRSRDDFIVCFLCFFVKTNQADDWPETHCRQSTAYYWWPFFCFCRWGLCLLGKVQRSGVIGCCAREEDSWFYFVPRRQQQ